MIFYFYTGGRFIDLSELISYSEYRSIIKLLIRWSLREYR